MSMDIRQLDLQGEYGKQNLDTLVNVAAQPYYYSVTATLNNVGELTNPDNGNPITFSDFWFYVTGIQADAIDTNTGVRLSSGAAFDLITVDITDKDSKTFVTNGQVDILTLNNSGQDYNWMGWLYRPLRYLNFKFLWTNAGAGLTGPILVTLNLRGYDLGVR